jgi:hypothetical protein
MKEQIRKLQDDMQRKEKRIKDMEKEDCRMAARENEELREQLRTTILQKDKNLADFKKTTAEKVDYITEALEHNMEHNKQL